MSKFIDGVIVTLCIGFVMKVSYDYGRVVEAQRNTKAWKELKKFAEESEKQFKDLVKEAKKQKAKEES